MSISNIKGFTVFETKSVGTWKCVSSIFVVRSTQWWQAVVLFAGWCEHAVRSTRGAHQDKACAHLHPGAQPHAVWYVWHTTVEDGVWQQGAVGEPPDGLDLHVSSAHVVDEPVNPYALVTVRVSFVILTCYGATISTICHMNNNRCMWMVVVNAAWKCCAILSSGFYSA